MPEVSEIMSAVPWGGVLSVVGFAVSIWPIGPWGMRKISNRLEGTVDPEDPPGFDQDDQAFPACIIGTAERLAFTAGFALWPTGAFPTAAGWVSVKMAANWMDREYEERWRNCEYEEWEFQDWVRGKRMEALVKNLASLGLAAVGGLLIKCGLGL